MFMNNSQSHHVANFLNKLRGVSALAAIGVLLSVESLLPAISEDDRLEFIVKYEIAQEAKELLCAFEALYFSSAMYHLLFHTWRMSPEGKSAFDLARQKELYDAARLCEELERYKKNWNDLEWHKIKAPRAQLSSTAKRRYASEKKHPFQFEEMLEVTKETMNEKYSTLYHERTGYCNGYKFFMHASGILSVVMSFSVFVLWLIIRHHMSKDEYLHSFPHCKDNLNFSSCEDDSGFFNPNECNDSTQACVGYIDHITAMFEAVTYLTAISFILGSACLTIQKTLEGEGLNLGKIVKNGKKHDDGSDCWERQLRF